MKTIKQIVEWFKNRFDKKPIAFYDKEKNKWVLDYTRSYSNKNKRFKK